MKLPLLLFDNACSGHSIMKVILVLCFVGLALAVPTPGTTDNKNAETLLYENDNTGFGPFRFVYEQSDGTKHEQQGEVIDEGRENERLVVKGKYRFVAPDGVVYAVRYVANENGYQPEIEKDEHERKVPENLGLGLGGRSAGEIARLLG